MNNKNKNIDNLFKNRLQNSEPEFNPEHWDKMASMLDSYEAAHKSADDNSKGFMFRWSRVGIIIIVSTFILTTASLFIIFGTNLLQTKTTLAENKQDISKKSTSIITNNEKQIIKTINKSKPEGSKIEKPNKKLFEEQIIQNSNSNYEIGLINTKKANSTSSKDIIFETEKKANNTKETPEIDNFKEKQIVQKTEQKDERETIIKDKKEIKTNINNNNISEIPIQQTEINEVKETFINNEIETPVTSNIKIIDTIKTLKTAEKSKKSVSENNSSILNTDLSNNKFFVSAGVNYYKTISNDENTKPKGMYSPIGGVGFEHKFKNRKLSLIVELQYTRSSGHSLYKSSQKVKYFFTKEISKTIVNTKSIDVLRLPLLLKYRYLNRHSISIGIFGSYVFNSESEITKMPYNKPITTYKANGYMEGFNDFSYEFTLGYNFKIIKQLELEFRMNYSPNDITKKSYYLNLDTDKSTELQFNIIWHPY